jgi:uncharacterized protein YqeY
VNASQLKQRLRADLKAAMQARATAEVRLLRTLIAAVDNAEAMPIEDFEEWIRRREAVGEVSRRDLDAAGLDAVLAAETESRLAAAGDYERNGRPEDAARLRAEADLIARYRV